jgi:NFU1 iron-sulfur cluster scaffold homolog, mitochondrial
LASPPWPDTKGDANAVGDVGSVTKVLTVQTEECDNPMFIQTEMTPNPATLKFLPGSVVMAHGTANFTQVEQTETSPLAKRLFGVDGVAGIFLGSDFITVTKDEMREWDVLKPIILSAIMDHFTAGQPVMAEQAAAVGSEDAVKDDEITAQIKELIETRVRPAVAQDGGDILFRGFEDGIVYLHMQGACSGCPSSTATLRHGIENMLRYYVPEVVEVRPIE